MNLLRSIGTTALSFSTAILSFFVALPFTNEFAYILAVFFATLFVSLKFWDMFLESFKQKTVDQ